MAHKDLEWAVPKARGLVQSRWQVLPGGRTMVGPRPHSHAGKDRHTCSDFSNPVYSARLCPLSLTCSLPVGVSFKPAVPAD